MNKTAKRRLKLFSDAEYYGADLLKSNEWIAAICRTYDQTHCFGRGKPKVVPGTNKIDPGCNLRDDEGIDGIHRKMRDSEKKDYIKDGIGFDDQPFEAGWCVMGGNRMYGGSTLAWGPGLPECESYAHGGKYYCPGKKPGEECPYIVFMEISSGKLYISNVAYSKWGMLALGDGWQIADFNCELNGDSEGGVARKILADPDFAKIMQQAVDASMQGMTGAIRTDVAAAARKSVRPGRLSDLQPSLQFGMTLHTLITAMLDAGAAKSDVLYYERKGSISKISRLKEGTGSSVIFDINGTDSVTAQELADYCRSRHIGKAESKLRKAEVKYDFSIYDISKVTREDGKIIMHY